MCPSRASSGQHAGRGSRASCAGAAAQAAGRQQLGEAARPAGRLFGHWQRGQHRAGRAPAARGERFIGMESVYGFACVLREFACVLDFSDVHGF
eukprot:7056497-Lingulodinium_polyedra.AAC.1